MGRKSHSLPARLSWLLAFVPLVAAAPARAEDTERKLSAYESEARQLGTDLPELNKLTGKAGQKRLVDAEVAFALGEYGPASLMLFEIANQPGPEQERATFYLGESLYLKGDRGAARTYFQQVVAKSNTSGKYYQPSLIRLVEIAVHQKDATDIDQVLSQLNNTAATPEVPYVKGKLAFSQDKHDEAIGFFNQVAKGSDHEMPALYFTGVSYVAKKDVNRATEIFTDLTSRKPKTDRERRISELSHLALGRLYYERDQPSKAIDSYLQIDRKSDLFADALYEVAWVYVKGKQFDKALRALELLHLSDPTSQKTPTVRILEGNLRIRKAQMLRQAIINGTIEKNPQDPSTEYDKAAAVFAETNALYLPSYKVLEHMVDNNADPAHFLGQIAGRSQSAFHATLSLPEAAAQYLREQPDVQRMVAVEADLGDIEANLKAAESMIARLEAVLAVNDRDAVYPQLQNRRNRIGQIQDDLIRLRADLHDQQLTLINGGADLASLTATRRQLMQQYRSMPSVEQAYASKVATANAELDRRDEALSEVRAAMDSAQAMAQALRKHSMEANPALADEQKKNIEDTLTSAGVEAAEIEAETAAIQAEIQLGRDLAGVGDENMAQARELRNQIRAAEDAEHKALSAAALSGSRDIQKSQQLNVLAERARRVAESLAGTQGHIDSLVDRGMAEVRVALETEKKNAANYKVELAEYSAESRSLGTTVLGGSFKGVKAKFYDIVIRTDVGTVDVNWAQKEDVDDDLNRLRLSRQRELKQLRDEFKGILDSGQPKQPAPGTNDSSLPGADPNNPGGSPDKGQAGDRVKPGGDKTNAPAPPVVKPDNDAANQPKPTTNTQKPGTPARGGGR